MKKYNALMSLLLAVCMLLTMHAACAQQSYTAGTYTASAAGNNADVKVQVVFDEGSIVSVEVVEHAETAGLADPALQRIPQRIVDRQTLVVDVVAGATNTSHAILAAVEDCVGQAGGSVDALKTAQAENAAADAEVVEMTADVIVVGGGGAGVTAAYAAAKEGASVILVEKMASLGGNTVLSGGSFNAAILEDNVSIPLTDSLKAEIQAMIDLEPKDEYMAKWQEKLEKDYTEFLAAGNTYLFDSAELHMLQTYVNGDYVGDPVLIENYCLMAQDTYYWMEQNLGVEWKPTSSAIQGSIWQRCHQAVGYTSGNAYIAPTVERIKEENLPAQILYEIRANELVVNETGRVVGVKGVSTVDGTQYVFHANSGVVLATGGFGANVEMRVKYNTSGKWKDLGESCFTNNAIGITGDGMVMAEQIGAQLVDMEQIQMLPTYGFDNVGDATGLVININGDRFVDETSRRDDYALAIMDQPEARCIVISSLQNSRLSEDADGNLITIKGKKLTDSVAAGNSATADTLEELAKIIGVDPTEFVALIEEFNGYVTAGYDPVFERSVFNTNAYIQDEGPYFAGFASPAIHHTMGGVKVDTQCRVINQQGEVIEGLYAAGEVTGDLHGGNRLGGNAISDALSHGRIAGTNAAAN